jgi:hypothetical protein
VYGRIHYAGLTVRGTGPEITAIRLSVLITFLTNRRDNIKQLTLYQSTLETVWPSRS